MQEKISMEGLDDPSMSIHIPFLTCYNSLLINLKFVNFLMLYRVCALFLVTCKDYIGFAIPNFIEWLNLFAEKGSNS